MATRRPLVARRVTTDDPLLGKLAACCDTEIVLGDAVIGRRHGVWDVGVHFACLADVVAAAEPDLADLPSVAAARAALGTPRSRRKAS